MYIYVYICIYMYIYVYICIYMYIYIYMFFNVFFACAKLHASKVGNWSVFVSVSFFVCVFECYFLLLATGECLAWNLAFRSYSCRLGSSYPNRVVKYMC